MKSPIIKVLLATALVFSSCSPVFAKTWKVSVLVDFLPEGFEPQFEILRREVEAVVGNSGTVDFGSGKLLINNLNEAVARQHYEEVQRDGTDIILAFGPVNNEIIHAQKVHRKPTILFGALNLDLVALDPSKPTSEINNFTYILDPSSYRRDLKSFYSLYPFKRVAVVLAAEAWESAEFLEVLDEVFAELNAEYSLINYQSVAQLESELGDADAVYMAEGFTVPPVQIKEMAELFIERKLPSYSNTQLQDVIDGWLATNQGETNFERLFRRIALGIEAVVDGRNLSSRPVFMELPDTLSVNFNTAERVGVPIRYSQIAELNLVGDFEQLVTDRTYSIPEAVDVALTSNLNLRASDIDVSLARENLANAKTSYYPDISVNTTSRYVDPDLARLSAGNNPEQSLSGSATISQTLYSEEGSTAIAQQGYLLRAEQETYNTAALDTVLATTQASFNLLRQKNTVRSQAENLEITQRNLSVARQNYEAGQSGKADIFRLQSELASNMQGVIDAINGYRQSQHSLNGLLNNPIGFRVDIEDIQIEGGPFVPEGFGYQELSQTLDDPAEQEIFLAFLLEQSFELSPELSALDFNLAAIERDVRQYGWRRYIPTVSASAQYNHIFDQSGVGVPDPNLALDSDYNVGLVFSIPLFNRNADNVSLRIARQQKEQLSLQIASQRQAIETRLRDAVVDVSGRIANIELSEVSETAALQSLELTEAAYANGAATITELIDSQNNYLQSQLASSNALYNFIDSALNMERATGIFLFMGNAETNDKDFAQRYRNYRETLKQENAQ